MGKDRVVIVKPEMIVNDLVSFGLKYGILEEQIEIEHEVQLAPHEPRSLPNGKCAIYVFSLSESYGMKCSAGAHRAIKVGRVGPKSNARFQSQHYNPTSAPSNLAATLLKSVILWPYLGITELENSGVGQWIRENTDRDHFYLDASETEVLEEFERYLRGKLGPVFEGG